MGILSVTSNNRPTIFIASSREALPTARAVKSNFDSEADVDIWNEDIFSLNNSYLSTLLNRAAFYDYAIVLFTPDDIAQIRDTEYKIPRDNILFEWGLFLGRIGTNRAFVIAEEEVKILSDIRGIHIATYRHRDPLISAVGNACDKIRKEMKVAEMLHAFSLLPSTSLAIGYYKNFIEKIINAFHVIDKYEVFEKDSKGKRINIKKIKVQDRYPSITILLPQRLSDLLAQDFRRKTTNLKQITVDTVLRPFPFFIEGDLSNENSVKFFDIPMTLLSSLETINRIFDEDFLARDNNREKIERREISNFEKTIRKLLPDRDEDKTIKFDILDLKS